MVRAFRKARCGRLWRRIGADDRLSRGLVPERAAVTFASRIATGSAGAALGADSVAGLSVTGSKILNREPLPVSLSTSTQPSCCLTTP